MNKEVLLLENNILEIDYCIPHPRGLQIVMSGQLFKGNPFGVWKKFDSHGNIINMFEGSTLPIYRIKKEN